MVPFVSDSTLNIMKRSELYLVKVIIVPLIIFAIDQPFVTFVHDSASVLAELGDKCTATRSIIFYQPVLPHSNGHSG